MIDQKAIFIVADLDCMLNNKPVRIRNNGDDQISIEFSDFRSLLVAWRIMRSAGRDKSMSLLSVLDQMVDVKVRGRTLCQFNAPPNWLARLLRLSKARVHLFAHT